MNHTTPSAAGQPATELKTAERELKAAWGRLAAVPLSPNYPGALVRPERELADAQARYAKAKAAAAEVTRG